ncbi:metallo-beta-lactamase family protein [alpha proteobacterium U9-1i]|nr:metallo-beta-lactamase family protein [alpha proteobacterium U9-1i]
MSKAGADELVFLPLGGSGEIGMNLNAYGFGPPDNRQWIIVDIGVTFGREDMMPGVDIVLPDPTFLVEERDNILGIVLTHAHEDHIGALPWLWPRLKAPLYATPFTAVLIREKLKERGLLGQVSITEIPLKGHLKLGPFDIDFVTLTHSIPEPNGLAIRTPLGLVWHTGDWKIDPDPIIGEVTDEAKLRSMAEEGILAMVCDSTNVFVEGESGSEADVKEHLTDVIRACKGKVAVTAFASNVARVDTVIRAAEACGRTVCLVGRSMHRIVGAAKTVGILKDIPELIDEDESGGLAAENILYLCTGSQGEPRAALARIASGDHRHVSLKQGDSVIFSSRMIPGNETAIHALYMALESRGVEVITSDEAHVHVSGHPARDELKQMYQWARPRIAVPVHGERRHLLEHVKLAQSLQVPEALAPKNGDLIRLAPGPAAIIDEVPAGRLYVDGNSIIEAEDEALRDRKRLGAEGAISVALAVGDKKHNIVAGPNVTVRGLSMADEEDQEIALEELEEAAEAAFVKLNHNDRGNDEAIETALVRAVRKAAERLWSKKPLVDVSVLRI